MADDPTRSLQLGSYQRHVAEKKDRSLSQRITGKTRASSSQHLEDENKQLKLLLDQSLRREADTLRRLKHLQEMYQALLYTSYGKQHTHRHSSTSEESSKDRERGEESVLCVCVCVFFLQENR